MCSIVGLIDKNDGDVGPMLKQMLRMSEHRGPDGSGIAIGTRVEKAEHAEEIDVEGLEGSNGIGHSRLRITGATGVQPLYGCNQRFALAYNGEIWNYQSLREELVATGHVFDTDSDSEVIVHLIEEKYRENTSFLDAVAETAGELDGEYTFAVFDTMEKTIALVRDPVGIKQIYYGEDSRRIGFSSEKKPLWTLDLEPERVLPGEIVLISEEGDEYEFTAHDNHRIPVNRVSVHDEGVALEQYRKELYESIEKRVRGQDHIGVIFSGGVDSVMVAQIAQQLGASITCYAAGFPGSSDMENARRAARDLDFDLRVNKLSEEKINAELEDIMTAVESTNHLQVDVAIPVYFAVKQASEDGLRVLLTGQGADELFAGYPWYSDILTEEGPEKLNQDLWDDILSLYKDTLEREDKITMYHGIELRVPFLDPRVIETAMSIAPSLKVKGETVKHVHRRLAEAIGIPDYIAWRPKEAAQHGSNVHDNLTRVIEDRDITTEQARVKREELGSAYRYAHDVYAGNEHIQQALDHIGNEIGVQ